MLRSTRTSTLLSLGTSTLVLALAFAGEAAALESCKAKLSPRDGAVQFSAKLITGSLRWGPTVAAAPFSFANEATCVAGDKANKCELGAAGTLERITPPAACTLFVADSSGGCSAYVQGCIPGLRPGGSERGFARAGVLVNCSVFGNDVSILSQFNNVNGSGFGISDGSVGEETCTVQAPFSLSGAFVVATPESNDTLFSEDYTVTVDVSGSSIRLRRAFGTVTNSGPIHVLIF
jgi:hypothetical protein